MRVSYHDCDRNIGESLKVFQILIELNYIGTEDIKMPILWKQIVETF